MSADSPKAPRRLFASTVSDVTPEDVTVDFGSLVERLLVADEFVLQSRNLQEVPYLVERFGADPVARLFSESGVRVSVEYASVTLVTTESPSVDPYRPLVGVYGYLQPGSSLDDIRTLDGQLKHLRTAERERVVRSVRDALVFATDAHQTAFGNGSPDVPGATDIYQTLLRDTFHEAVQNPGMVYPFVEEALFRKNAAKAGKPFAFSVELGDMVEGQLANGEPYTARQLVVTTDLEERYGLRPGFVGDVIREALLGLAGEVRRVSEMKLHDAVTEFNPDDSSLFGSHLEYLSRRVLPEAVDGLYRTIRVANVPDFRDPGTLGGVNLDALIDARSTGRADEFRDLIWRPGGVDEEEVARALAELPNALWERIGVAVQSNKGRAIRALVVGATGLAEGVSVGLPLGVANAVLVDRMFPSDGPAPMAFVRDEYPSVFTPDPMRYASHRDRRRAKGRRRRGR